MTKIPRKMADVNSEPPVTLTGDISIQDALEVMQSWGFRHFPVVDNEERLIGLISERDIFRKQAHNRAREIRVSDTMTLSPFSVDRNTAVSKVVLSMAEAKVGSAVVIDSERRVIGIFTTTDALYILADLLDDEDNHKLPLMTVEEYLKRAG